MCSNSDVCSSDFNKDNIRLHVGKKKGKKDKKGNTSKKDKHFSVIFMCSEYTALEAVV